MLGLMTEQTTSAPEALGAAATTSSFCRPKLGAGVGRPLEGGHS